MAEIIDNFNKISIKKFDGKDFGLWKDKIVVALKAAKVVAAIEEKFQVKDDDDEAIEKDDKAKIILMSAISDDVLRRITRRTAKEIWTQVIAKYEDKHAQNKAILRRRFLNAKQDQNESLQDFVDRIKNLREELEATSYKVTDQDTAITLLQGVIPAYDSFVQCIFVTHDLDDEDDVNLEDIISQLTNEEKRRNERRQEKQEKKYENEQVFHSKDKKEMKKKYFKDVKCYN
jgi:hypothetical protein